MGQKELDNWFSYHPPKEGQAECYEEIRAAGKAFAQKLLELTPHCADQSASIQKIRAAVFLANAAIACSEYYP